MQEDSFSSPTTETHGRVNASVQGKGKVARERNLPKIPQEITTSRNRPGGLGRGSLLLKQELKVRHSLPRTIL